LVTTSKDSNLNGHGPSSSQQSTSSSGTLSSPSKTPSNWTPGGGPYYLENFLSVLNSVEADDHHSHLLNEEDRQFTRDFHGLSNPSQCLYVRLFQRKWQWKPASSIKYPKITDNLTPGFEELYRHRFLVEIKGMQSLTFSISLTLFLV
jgi:Fanconi-associated nuclease 1